jgi:sec-independent protein translocase protein TatC
MATLLRRPGAGAPKPHPDEMTLVEHLAELRRRLIVSMVVLVLAAIFCYIAYNPILHFFLEPLCASTKGSPQSCKLYITSPLDAFAIRLEITGYGALFLTSPVLLFNLWRFITPGLKANEKRYALPFVIATVAFFCFGAYVAILTYPHALHFFTSVGGSQLTEIYSPSKYLGLYFLLMVIFGATFEFPVILVALELVGILTPKRLSKWRRPAIVIIVLAAAIITPSSDPFSMLAMAIPLLVFYELAIVTGRLLGK